MGADRCGQAAQQLDPCTGQRDLSVSSSARSRRCVRSTTHGSSIRRYGVADRSTACVSAAQPPRGKLVCLCRPLASVDLLHPSCHTLTSSYLEPRLVSKVFNSGRKKNRISSPIKPEYRFLYLFLVQKYFKNQFRPVKKSDTTDKTEISGMSRNFG